MKMLCRSTTLFLLALGLNALAQNPPRPQQPGAPAPKAPAAASSPQAKAADDAERKKLEGVWVGYVTSPGVASRPGTGAMVNLTEFVIKDGKITAKSGGGGPGGGGPGGGGPGGGKGPGGKAPGGKGPGGGGGGGQGGGGLGEGTFTLNLATEPRQMDALGTGGQTAGKTYLGIYRWNGENLEWCAANPGIPRPTSFFTKPQVQFQMLLTKKKA